MDVVCNFLVMASFNHIKYTFKHLNRLCMCRCLWGMSIEHLQSADQRWFSS